MDALIAFVILGAVSAFSIGCAKLVAWFFDRREADAARVIREASIIARAKYEVGHG